jgi:hypothetical protein
MDRCCCPWSRNSHCRVTAAQIYTGLGFVIAVFGFIAGLNVVADWNHRNQVRCPIAVPGSRTRDDVCRHSGLDIEIGN